MNNNLTTNKIHADVAQVPSDLDGFDIETTSMELNAYDGMVLYYRLHNAEMRYSTAWNKTLDGAIWEARDVLAGISIEAKKRAQAEATAAYRNSPEYRARQAEDEKQRAQQFERIKRIAPLTRRNLRPGTCDGCGKKVLPDAGLLVRNGTWGVRCEDCVKVSHPQILDAVWKIDEETYGAVGW